MARGLTLLVAVFAAGCRPGELGDTDIVQNHAFADTAQKASVAGQSRFDLYFTQPGTGAGPIVDPIADDDLIALIDGATTTLAFASFDFDRLSVSSALIRARDRGVAVRGVADADLATEAGWVALAQAGIALSMRPAGTAIMHNKFVVVDGRYVWMGSANLGDNDFLRNNNNAVILESPQLAAEYTAEFEEMWAGRFGRNKSDVHTSNAVTVNDALIEHWFGPKEMLLQQLIAKTATAEHSIYFLIFTFSRTDLRDALLARKSAGVAVRGVFDNLQSGNTFSQDEALAMAGVPTFVDGNDNGFQGGIMHHKVLILDADTDSDPTVLTGSVNWSDQADQDNDENLIAIHSAAAARAYLREYCAVVSVATPHPLYTGNDTGCRGRVLINEVMPNPTGTDLGHEYVEIVNAGYAAMDLGGWSVVTGSGTSGTTRHVFAPGWSLPPEGVIALYDRGSHADPGVMNSSTASLSLLNSGGFVSLVDAKGAVVDRFDYGAADAEGISYNRVPDANLTASGTIMPHNGVPGATLLASPGLHVDGTPFGATAVLLPTMPRAAARELLISQFATRGIAGATDEFVELYNNSDHALDVGSVRLQYQSATCSGWSDRARIPAGTTLAPGQFFLVANPGGYLSPGSGPAPNQTMAAGISDNGFLRIVDGTAVVDLVGYGAGLACTGEGGTAAPNHGTTANGNSVGRRPQDYSTRFPARDTDDNAADFDVRIGRQPRNLASPAQPSYILGPPAPGELVVTQMSTRGLLSASDEFIEIYNRSSKRLQLDGVRVQYESSTCGGFTDRAALPSGLILAPGQFFLLANSTGYVAPASGPMPDATFTSGMADAGLVRLLGADRSTVLDLVAYGGGLACTGEGGTVAPNHGTKPNGASIARHPFTADIPFTPETPAQDSDNNLVDFGVRYRSPRSLATPAQSSF